MDCAICIAKTKVLISCVVTAQLICIFVFAYAISRFSHNVAHMKGCGGETAYALNKFIRAHKAFT